jgi:hypothetical protein
MNILDDITLETINCYIEKNLDDFYKKATEHPNFSSKRDGKISWVMAKNVDWPDCIYRANFENLAIKKEIIKVKKLIRKGKAPNGWTVGPLTKPNDLGAFLEKYDFTNVYQQAGMALQLKNLEQEESKADAITIEKVDNKENLNQWANIVSKVFDIKIDVTLLKFLYLQEEPQFYLGEFEGHYVSTLMMYLSSGVAGLHAVSTLPEYQGKGLGLSISRKALIDAYKNGYHIGVLQASSLGERVYRKLGFEKYCDIISYALLNE